MGWDWVKILKEEMLDLKPDEHLSRHAATDRLAWVSSQAPARAPMPAEDEDDRAKPAEGDALLGWAASPDQRVADESGFNAGPLYPQQGDPAPDASRNGSTRVAPPPVPTTPSRGEPAPGRGPEAGHDWDFAMPTSPPLQHPGGPPVGAPGAGAPDPHAYGSNGQAMNGHASNGYAANGPAANGYAANGYAGDGYDPLMGEQGHVLTLLVDGVLAGVALPNGSEVTVGRERQSTLVVPEAKQTVSRRALTLVRTARRSVEARVENRNGAWVTRQMPEGARQEFVERGQTVTLRVGDRLSLDPPGTVVVGLTEPH